MASIATRKFLDQGAALHPGIDTDHWWGCIRKFFETTNFHLLGHTRTHYLSGLRLVWMAARAR